MKKIFVIVMAFSALFACKKESAPAEQQTNQQSESVAIWDAIPNEIVGEIAEDDTKTQYANNETFGWTEGDLIRMPVCKKSGENWTGNADYFTYTGSGINSGDRTATFVRNGTDPKEDFDAFVNPTNGWYDMGYLVYPTSIFTDKEREGSYPIVSLPNTYTYNADYPLNSASGITVPMIGRKNAGGKYKFSTAVGFLKVHINNVPGDASKVQLLSSANNIAGKFAITDETTTIAQITNTPYSDGGTGTITLNVSGLTDGAGYDFYFPMPVGTYSAGSLTIKIANDSRNLFRLIVSKEITIERNVILELPNVTPDSVVLVETNDATNPRITWSMMTSRGRIGIYISQSEETEPASFVKYYNASSNKTDSFNLKGLKNGSDEFYLTNPGQYYLHYIVLSDTGTATSLTAENVRTYGSIKFHFLPETNITGTYGNGTYTWTFATSDKCSQGNVKITGTSIWSLTGNIYGVYNGETITFDGTRTRFESHKNHCIVGNWNGDIAESYQVSPLNDIVFTVEGSNLSTSKIGIGSRYVTYDPFSMPIVETVYMTSISFPTPTTWTKQ